MQSLLCGQCGRSGDPVVTEIASHRSLAVSLLIKIALLCEMKVGWVGWLASGVVEGDFEIVTLTCLPLGAIRGSPPHWR